MSRSQVANLGNGASVMINRPPTLIANMDPAVVNYEQGMANSLGAMVILADPLTQAAAQVAASLTATVGGSVSAGDTIGLTLRGASIGPYVVLTADTATTIAAALAALVNNSANTLIKGIIVASSSGAVLTLRTIAKGPVGNSYTVASTIVGVVTLTPASGNLASGSGAVKCLQSFTFTFGNVGMSGGAGASTTLYFLEGKEYLIGDPLLTAMVNAGMPIV